MLSPADADIVRREQAVPGLRTLLDPDEFATMLRGALAIGELGKVRPIYARYRPGTSCLAAYKLRVGEESITVYAKALRRDALGALRKVVEGPKVPGKLGPGAMIWEDRAVAMLIFPNDGKLEVLPRLVDDDTKKHLLSELLPDRPDLWESIVEGIRYKPERRFLARLLVGARPGAALKVYNQTEYAIGANNTAAVQSRGPLRVARVLGRSDRHRVLVLEWMAGQRLSELLLQPEPSLQSVRLTGAALAELHAQRSAALPRLARDREAATLLTAGEVLGILLPNLAQRANGLARELAERLAAEPQLHRPIHGDFKGQQVLVGGDSVAIVDFDHAAAGDPSSDLGLFLAHLEKEALRGDMTRNRLETVKGALLEGYRQVAGDIPGRIELHTAARLLQIARRRYRHRRPDWPESSEILLDRVDVILKTIAGNVFRTPPGRQAKGDIPVADAFGVAYDPAMPFLAGALHPSEVESQLERHIPQLYSGKARLSLRAIRVTRYRPEQRCVIEYDLDLERSDATSETITLVGKARARGPDELTFSLVASLWSGSFGTYSQDGISVPEPLGVVPAFNMWLQRKVPGVTAAHLMAGPDGIALVRRIAEAAHKLHRAGVPSSRSHTMADELRILHERLPRMAQARPEWADRVERLLSLCDRLGGAIPEPKVAGIHRDFYPSNVIVDGPRLYVLDFDLYCNGDPGLDIGNFLGHMTEHALRVLGDPAALADREDALAERFIELSGEGVRASLNAYATLTLVRHVHLSTQFPERRRFTEGLLELSEQRLGAVKPQDGEVQGGSQSGAAGHQ